MANINTVRKTLVVLSSVAGSKVKLSFTTRTIVAGSGLSYTTTNITERNYTVSKSDIFSWSFSSDTSSIEFFINDDMVFQLAGEFNITNDDNVRTASDLNTALITIFA
jgi:hypothetical protein